MKKAIVEFHDEEELTTALNGWKYEGMIEEIWQKCFRPARKHGYGDELLDSDQGREVIEKLIKIYIEITKED